MTAGAAFCRDSGLLLTRNRRDQNKRTDTTINTATVNADETAGYSLGSNKERPTFPSRIELLNRGATTVILAGITLTDDESNPARFTFPADTNLGAGQRLVVYANAPDDTSGIHIGFGLSRNGETLQLYHSAANEGALLDEVKFGIQLPDLSISRMAEFQWELTPPTMGSANG